MPAGDSEQARENRQANQREQESIRRKSAGGRRMPAGDSQQARYRTDKLDRCGSQQAAASTREKEANRWKPVSGRWKPARGLPASSVNDNDSDNDTNDNDSDNGNYNRRYPLPCMLELSIA